MSINLLEIAQSTLGPILLSKAGDLFGLNQEQGKSALASVLPTLLGGILNKASTNSGAAALYKAVSDPSIDSNIAGNLAGVLGNATGVSKLGEQGGKILGFLFGDKATGLGEQVAQLAGVPAKGTSSLLAMAAPAVFGLLKSHIIGNKLSPHGFTSLLSSQAPHLEKSLPETVLEWLGWGSLATFIGGLGSKFTGALSGLSNLFDGDDDVKKPVGNYSNNKKGGGFWKWLLPLALLALAALLFKSCQQPEEEKPADMPPPPAAEVAPAPAPAPVEPAKPFNAEAAIAESGNKFADAIKALTASGKCDSDALVSAMNLYVVNFASASASIPAKDVTALQTAVPAVTACAKEGVKIEVGGHTDNQGQADANLKLSQARANALKALFVKAGVSADAITTKGYGDANPVGDNATEEGRFQNRRIAYTKQ